MDSDLEYCQPCMIRRCQSCLYELTSFAEGRVVRRGVEETAGPEVQQTLELKPKRPHRRLGTLSEVVIVVVTMGVWELGARIRRRRVAAGGGKRKRLSTRRLSRPEDPQIINKSSTKSARTIINTARDLRLMTVLLRILLFRSEYPRNIHLDLHFIGFSRHH